jgi:alkanesulfonate monooxygenase SsuD/methylene tetrahydromethanopterin reductase-like flavin-dependent oxidoreductase (luciferase family)
VTAVLDLIVAARRDDPLGAVEHGVFGTTDPARLADEYARWCRSALGSNPRSAWMFNVSTGCVAGIELEDGRRVVVKAYPPHRPLSRLNAVLAVQRLAVERGLPVPAPIAGPEPMGLGWASAEQAMDVGRSPNLLDPRDRATTAAGWVQFVDSLNAAYMNAGRLFALYNDIPSYRTILDREGKDTVADVALIGNEDQVGEQLADLADAGVTDFAAVTFGAAEEFDRTVALLSATRLD